MEYILLFLEGIITFISPCLLPMLPIYFSYFSGGETDSKYHTIKNSIAFVIGFSIIFTLMGAFAGTIGGFFNKYIDIINIILGTIIIIFGLNYVGLFKISFLNKTKKANIKIKEFSFGTTIIFGMIFAIGWTPCVGSFLGSALLIASQSGNTLQGMLMLLIYSLGLGIPFIFSAILINKMKKTFDFIKRNYKVINIISGIILIVIGIFIATGYFGKLLSILSI